MQDFCTEAGLKNPKCYSLETFDFLSEESIFDVLLDVLKSELPARMAALKDCNNEPMYISEENIDIIYSENTPHFEVVLNPLSDIAEYTEPRNFRTVDYNFELILTVHNTDKKCLTWELLRFKNAIEGLIVATEFVIDGYESVLVEPRGFNYYVPEEVGRAVYMRQGSYRFTVTVTQDKIY